METEISFDDPLSLESLRVEPLEPRIEFSGAGCDGTCGVCGGGEWIMMWGDPYLST